MTIRHLKIFITVADVGSMSGAAKLLYISQPTVSQAIAELESYYDIKLFERLSRKLYITDGGSKLLPYARHIVDSFDKMEEDIRMSGLKNTLKIGSSVSVGTVLLNRYLDGLYRIRKDINTKVTVDNTYRIEQMILNSQIDVAIVEGLVESNDIISIPVANDELFMVVGKDHPFYTKDKIELKELNGQSLISREQGSADRNQFEILLNTHGIIMDKSFSSTNTEAIKSAVIAGRGIAIMSGMLLTKELEDKSLKRLNVDGIKVKRDIKLIYHRNKYVSQIMNDFIGVCKDCNS